MRNRFRVWRRKAELRRAINTSRMVVVAWQQELSYIERTGKLDWVDPNPIRIHSREEFEVEK